MLDLKSDLDSAQPRDQIIPIFLACAAFQLGTLGNVCRPSDRGHRVDRDSAGQGKGKAGQLDVVKFTVSAAIRSLSHPDP